MGISLGVGATVAASVAALAVAYPAFWLWEVGRLEKPRYTVLRLLDKNKELRRYDPYIIAETEVRDDETRGDNKMKGAMNAGASHSRRTRVWRPLTFGHHAPRTQASGEWAASSSGGTRARRASP